MYLYAVIVIIATTHHGHAARDAAEMTPRWAAAGLAAAAAAAFSVDSPACADLRRDIDAWATKTHERVLVVSVAGGGLGSLARAAERPLWARARAPRCAADVYMFDEPSSYLHGPARHMKYADAET